MGSSTIGSAILAAQLTKEDAPHTDLEGSSTIGASLLSANVIKSSQSVIPLEGTTTIGAAFLSAELTKSNPSPIALEGSSTIGAAILSAVALTKSNPSSIALEGSASIGSANLSATITLRGADLSLTDFNTLGLEIDALALIVASGNTTWYADSDRGGSDTPLDGELGLAAGETVISRIFWNGSIFRINDNDDPVTLNLGSYFAAGGDGNDLKVYVQTDDGIAVFDTSNISGTSNSARVTFSPTGDAVTILDGIGDGDRFIIAFARSNAIALEGSATIGSPTLAVSALSSTSPISIALEGSANVGAATLSAELTKSTPSVTSLEGSAFVGAVTLSAVVTKSDPPRIDLEGSANVGAATLSAELTKSTPSVTLEGSASVGAVVLELTKSTQSVHSIRRKFRQRGHSFRYAD